MGSLLLKFAGATTGLDVIADSLESVPYWMKVAGLCIVSSTVADDLKERFLLHFWVTFLAGWGGGLSASILLARPDALPINMFGNGHDATIVAIWWLANHFPFGGPGYLLRLRPVQLVAGTLRHVARAATMTKVMTLTAQLHPAATVAVVIMGCISGAGGKVWHDVVRGGYHLARSPDEVSVPGMGLHSAMAGSVLYYWLVIVQQVLSQRQGHALLWSLFVANTLVVELTGWNGFAGLATIAHTLTNVPQPRAPVSMPAPSGKLEASKAAPGADNASSSAAGRKKKR